MRLQSFPHALSMCSEKAGIQRCLCVPWHCARLAPRMVTVRYDSQIAPLTGLTLDVQGRQQQQQQSNYGGFGGYNAGGYGGYGHMQGGQAPNGDSFKMQ